MSQSYKNNSKAKANKTPVISNWYPQSKNILLKENMLVKQRTIGASKCDMTFDNLEHNIPIYINYKGKDLKKS